MFIAFAAVVSLGLFLKYRPGAEVPRHERGSYMSSLDWERKDHARSVMNKWSSIICCVLVLVCGYLQFHSGAGR